MFGSFFATIFQVFLIVFGVVQVVEGWPPPGGFTLYECCCSNCDRQCFKCRNTKFSCNCAGCSCYVTSAPDPLPGNDNAQALIGMLLRSYSIRNRDRENGLATLDPPTFDPQTFDPQTFDSPTFDPPTFDPPTFDPPTFDAPAFDTPKTPRQKQLLQQKSKKEKKLHRRRNGNHLASKSLNHDDNRTRKQRTKTKLSEA